METAAQTGDINALYSSIQSDPKILDSWDGTSFADTPLHISTAAGHTQFALEIMNLKPSLGRKLNTAGLSPLHVALYYQQWETALRLVKLDSDLVQVKGREGLTPLHSLAKMNDDQAERLLAEFLCACPASIRNLTNREETALHVAVKSRNAEAFNVLFQWAWRTYNREVLIWGDEDDNTVLHVAAGNKQPQIVELVLKRASRIINMKNSEGQTALDLALSVHPDEETAKVTTILRRAHASKASSPRTKFKYLSEYLKSPEYLWEILVRFIIHRRKGLSIHMCNVVLVVAVLIATATFQTVLQPPKGGDNYDKHNKRNQYVLAFHWLNALAFMASIVAIITVLEWQFYTWLLHGSLLFLVWSYVLGILLLGPPVKGHPWMLVGAMVPAYAVYVLKLYFRILEIYVKFKAPSWAFHFPWNIVWRFVNNERSQMLCRLVDTEHD